ncbi:MAG: LysR family transcriptional regulator [Puniceicoccales bacterium]|jgi:DNA-binding transcriptional LysR family regulator|nr:LysR family transcriptional regulator [Puniceicoccales bacterium]
MNIKTLKIFSDLVANANFSKTAKQNNVSQSAISQKIRLLEDRLNVHLVEKKKKSFQLTEEGTVFYHHAKLILSEYEAMLEDLQNYDAKTLGGVSLLTNYWIGVYLLPHYVREYFKTFKNCALDINYGDFNGMQITNLDPRSDLIILEFPPQNEDLAVELFAKDEFVAVCSAQSELKSQALFPLENLASQPLIGFTKLHPLRTIFEQGLERQIMRPHYAMEFNQIDLIKQAVETHNGVAILPKSSIRPARESHIFHTLSLKDRHIPISLYFIYRKNRKMNRSLTHFIAILRGETVFQEEPSAKEESCLSENEIIF